jgi:hypothetical protein
MKRRIAKGKNLKILSILGRATLTNFMIYSVPRYWVQTMAAPRPPLSGSPNKCLEADVYELLRERETQFSTRKT